MRRFLSVALMAAMLLAMAAYLVGCAPASKSEPATPVEPVTPVPVPGGSKKLSELVKPISPTVKITVGLKQAVSDSGILLGVAKGYYKELGIEIET